MRMPDRNDSVLLPSISAATPVLRRPVASMPRNQRATADAHLMCYSSMRHTASALDIALLLQRGYSQEGDPDLTHEKAAGPSAPFCDAQMMQSRRI